MAPEAEKSAGWFRRALQAFGRRRRAGSGRPRAPELYALFREILALNDDALELFASVEDTLSGRAPLAFDVMSERLRHALHDAQRMVDNLQRISGAHGGLSRALSRISDAIAEQLPARKRTFGPLVIPLQELRAGKEGLAGGKLANLAEAWWGGVGVEIPDGFAITSAAFARVMADNALWEQVDALEHACHRGTDGVDDPSCTPDGVAAASAAVQDAFREAKIPSDVSRAVLSAFDELARGDARTRVALRSSAVGEDRGEASHAGLYHTEVDVDRDGLLDAYRAVLASAFSPAAVVYRAEQDISSWEAAMAVGCLRMVQARCAGVAFSRDFARPDSDRVLVAAVPGIGVPLVGGQRDAEEIVVESEHCDLPADGCVTRDDAVLIARTTRVVERHFRKPVDVEWAIDRRGELYVLQARPMTGLAEAETPAPAVDAAQELLRGGRVACPGLGAGRVFRLVDGREPDAAPAGSVVVARHSTPALAVALNRIAAVVTEVGSPIGHMAILAREYRVPCIVGLGGALQQLADGQEVTVDATRCRVLAGLLPLPRRPRRTAEPRAVGARGEVSDAELLERVARFVTPLNLTDPASPEFRPEGCRTLHDVARYVHEQVFEVMFQMAERAEHDGERAVRLRAKLPFGLLVHDVGGGFAVQPAAQAAGELAPEDITSVPMRAFVAGLLDERIRWDLPRPLSTRGFLSVVGATMSQPPAEAQQLGRTSYAVISDRYMNFSTKAGYHFSTVDTYCGRSQNKNYAHFRFSGGAAGADRRERRIRFLTLVLDQLGFRTSQRGDALVARLDKREQATIQVMLTRLGQLTLVTRQLDMLMDSDESPGFFARAFLEDKLETF